MRVNYAIVFVSDMAKSVAFYRDVLELPLRFETPHWTEFATDGATLALHISKEAGSNDDAEDPPAGRCRTGFSVGNLDEYHKRLMEKGVPCLQPPKNLFGAMIAQYRDPDGMVFSVSQAR